MARRRDMTTSTHTTSTGHTRRSSDSYASGSTDPSSLYDSPPPSAKGSSTRTPRRQPSYYHEDLSPATSLYPRSSVETYSSRASYDEDEESVLEDGVEYPEIPPLPVYRHEIEDINVRPSTPEDFAALFPSMNKLIIRHDDLTPDGNMNLRVDTVVSGRRKRTIQLFHLRMRDLNKREFSLRRYCRDSGREVCNSKRKYIDPIETRHPKLRESVSTAVKTLTCRPTLRRSPTYGSLFSVKSRPGTSHSTTQGDDEGATGFDHPLAHEHKPKARPIPTNTMKLEFSNYARVDIRRRGHKVKKYEFEWWQHNYSWRRIVDKLTGTISFHLFRDGDNAPVAHIVPETRTPNQIEIDEEAGGWIPPYHMWISDRGLIDVQTDVADVVVATGLMALVDDCIKSRWQPNKNRVRRFSLPDVEFARPRSFVQHLLHRRFSEHHQQRPNSPLRSQRAMAAY
ncbi:hypothetical protein SAMD00023353_0104210 [Rosellinia necatrix]|uniref:Uncharacterized protein n=1 Tax=Rosellinia necatrix TaxID=77044 RepID=A0A1S7UIT3_ROSNE|nr:hypothetical protein SAMD00023353_0104210 [Rosellinia necatrix]